MPEGREFAIPIKALLQADNIEYLPSGAVQGRRGTTKLNSSALAGAGNSLWRHYPRTGSATTLVGVTDGSNTDFSNASGTSGTFSAASGGSNIPGTKFWFTNWPAKEKSYLASLTSGLYYYNGSAIAAVSPDADNEITLGNLGPYLIQHKGRLWVTATNELSYSIYPSEVGFDNKFLADSQISANDNQGGLITGLGSFFDYLLIFKSSCIKRFVGDVSTFNNVALQHVTDVGAIAPRSIAATPWGYIYVGREGVYITDGTQPNPDELSYPIRSLFVNRTGSTQYPNAVGRWYPIKKQYVLKLDPSHAYAYVLTRVELLEENPLIGQRVRVAWLWSYHSKWAMNDGVSWDSESDDGRLIGVDDNGFVRTYDTGSTDDGDSFTSTIQTASRVVDGSGRTGRAMRVKCLHRASGTLSGVLRYDQSTSDDVPFTLGDSTLSEKWQRTYIGDKSKLGRFVSVKLSRAGDHSNFEVHLIDLDMRLRAPRVWRARNA